MALKAVSHNPTEIEHILFRRGVLTHKLHAGQLVIEKSFNRVNGKLFVADCSRQLGKSTWAAFKAVETAIRRPNSRIRVATAFLTDLEQFIVPAFEFVLDGGPEDVTPKFLSQKKEYLFPNGSKIRLVGLDRKPNGLRGNRLDLVILDEAGYIARLDYLYRYVLIPATTHVPHAKILMLSTQPESPDHDFVSFCDKAETESAYVKLTIHDNPLLDREAIDKLAEECGGYESTAFRREYLCERIVEEGRAIVPEFKASLHVATHTPGPYHHFWHRIESLDSGVRDQTACLFGFYDFLRAKLVIEGEFYLQGEAVTTKAIAHNVMKTEAELGYNRIYRRIADNDNLILVQDLDSDYNLNFFPTNKDELVAMVNKVRLWMQAGRIEIHPRCTHLIGSLKAGIWNKTKSEFDRSPKYGHYDAIAALVYMVRNVPDNDNPVPIGYGMPMSDTLIITKPNQESDAALIFKRGFEDVRSGQT